MPGCNPKVSNQTVTQWYNPACFVSPASLAVGPGYGFGDTPLGFLTIHAMDQSGRGPGEEYPDRRIETGCNSAPKHST